MRQRTELMRHVTAIAVAALILTGPSTAQTPTTSRTREHVHTLASERFGGRGAGSDGERLAGDYIAAELARLGARPLPGRADMFASFEFTAGSNDGGSRLSVSRGQSQVSFDAPMDLQALSFSDDADLSASAVFAGYGIVVPDSQNFGYDSYAGLDVRDKIVVVLRYFPEDADQKTRAILARYSDLRYKAMAARQRGARALLVVTGPRSPNAGQTIPMTFDTALAGSGIPAASGSGRVASALFAGGRPLQAVQEELDSGNPHVAGFDLPGVSVALQTAVIRQKQFGRNVVAFLPASSPVAAIDKPWVAIGAHYDHLGRGDNGNSLAARDEIGRAHLGADDNASGTAAVLTIARTLAAQPRARHLLIALWSAEEIGLIGSRAFVGAPPVPVDQIAAYLNFDMVGRMQDNKLAVQAVGTSAFWPPLAARVSQLPL